MKTKHRKTSRAKRTIKARNHRAARKAPARKATAPAGVVRHATRVDGVNVNDMVIMSETVKNQPALAEYKFRASTRWLGGAHAKTTVQSFWGSGREDHSRKTPFIIESDEPVALLGTNQGPSAVEYALAGLGSSFAEWVAYNAAARGIQLDSMQVELEGGMDLRGPLGIREGGKSDETSKTLRPGFENIRILCHLESKAPPSELKELVEYAKQTCPVFDMFRNPVPIAVEIKH